MRCDGQSPPPQIASSAAGLQRARVCRVWCANNVAGRCTVICGQKALGYESKTHEACGPRRRSLGREGFGCITHSFLNMNHKTRGKHTLCWQVLEGTGDESTHCTQAATGGTSTAPRLDEALCCQLFQMPVQRIKLLGRLQIRIKQDVFWFQLLAIQPFVKVVTHQCHARCDV